MALTTQDIAKLIAAFEKIFVTKEDLDDKLTQLKSDMFDHIDPVVLD